MAATTYKAKSISGAEREVRGLRRQIEHLNDVLGRYMDEAKQLQEHRRTLAKLAAEGAAFDNPLVAMAAKELRNRILRDECSLAPDGTYLG